MNTLVVSVAATLVVSVAVVDATLVAATLFVQQFHLQMLCEIPNRIVVVGVLMHSILQINLRLRLLILLVSNRRSPIFLCIPIQLPHR